MSSVISFSIERGDASHALVAPALHRAMSPVWDQPVLLSPDAWANRYRQSATELCRAGPMARISRAERRAIRLSRRNYRETREEVHAKQPMPKSGMSQGG